LRFVLDSSSIINLFNAGALALLCQLPEHEFSVSPMVVGECHGECAATLVELRDEGCLTFIDDDVVDADQYLTLLEVHGLGAGETECMAVAAADDYSVCSDDRKAREAAADLIGGERVIGSLRLLQWCVRGLVIDCEQAFVAFLSMKEMGGFLPDMPQSFFCEDGC
jgi:predicted nucleic acid-binding protein